MTKWPIQSMIVARHHLLTRTIRNPHLIRFSVKKMVTLGLLAMHLIARNMQEMVNLELVPFSFLYSLQLALWLAASGSFSDIAKVEAPMWTTFWSHVGRTNSNVMRAVGNATLQWQMLSLMASERHHYHQPGTITIEWLVEVIEVWRLTSLNFNRIPKRKFKMMMTMKIKTENRAVSMTKREKRKKSTVRKKPPKRKKMTRHKT